MGSYARRNGDACTRKQNTHPEYVSLIKYKISAKPALFFLYTIMQADFIFKTTVILVLLQFSAVITCWMLDPKKEGLVAEKTRV